MGSQATKATTSSTSPAAQARAPRVPTGGPSGIARPSVANPIRFQGQHLDSQTGLYKMGLRYYDPTIGRWTQKDPLNLYQDPKQANRYAYAGSDPVNNADPSGATYCTEQGICFWPDSNYSPRPTPTCLGYAGEHPECPLPSSEGSFLGDFTQCAILSFIARRLVCPPTVEFEF